MNENLVENYKEEQPDFQQDVSFSRGQRDVTTNEEVEYEFDFEECPEDNDNDENEENDRSGLYILHLWFLLFYLKQFRSFKF